MTAMTWTFTDADTAVAQEMADFLPEKIFDFHAHLYHRSNYNGLTNSMLDGGPSKVGIDLWRNLVERQSGRALLTGGLFFWYPGLRGDIEAGNRFVASEIKSQPGSCGLMAVWHGMDAQSIAPSLANPAMAGFKPYHVFGDKGPNMDMAIEDYLPTWLWEIADERGLLIMLHLVKRLALADPDNQAHIRRMCGDYPNARLVLAHCARGFHSFNTLKGLPAIRDLSNIWFDTSGICEPEAIAAVLNAFGPSRLLWGSDFPISQLHGKCVTIGDGFEWILADPAQSRAYRPILVGLESLRALRQAAAMCGLTPGETEDVFYNNAVSLLGKTAGAKTLPTGRMP